MNRALPALRAMMGRSVGAAHEEMPGGVSRYLKSGSGPRPAGRGLTELRSLGRVSFQQRHLDLEREPGDPAFTHRPPPSKWRTFPWGAVVAWGVAVLAIATVLVIAHRTTQVDLTQDDLEDGAVLNEQALEDLEVRMQLASSDDANSAVLAFGGEEIEVEGREDPEDDDGGDGDASDGTDGDGTDEADGEEEADNAEEVGEAALDGEAVVWRPPEGLGEGEYELRLTVPRLLMGPADFTWQFEVDTTAPDIELPEVVDPAGIDDEVTVEGTVEEGSEVRTSAGVVSVGDDGSFVLELARTPAGPVRLEAVDAAENRSVAEVIVPVDYPDTRSVYVTAAGWADQARREQILALADQGRIDAVHVQLKASDGTVGFDTTVGHAGDIGAVTVSVNLDALVEALHERDVRVVGRLSAFTDPELAAHSWGSDARGQVLQAPSGEPFGSEPEWTNPADTGVQTYNLDLAVDAVERGVDEIVWDGVLLPGGEEELALPGFEAEPVEAVAGFLARSHTELRRHGAVQGAATPGLAIYQDQASADITRVARHVDYLAPRIEPLYWSGGSLDVANPAGSPGEFVRAYLDRYGDLAGPSGTAVVPELQAFSYGDGDVRAQASAAADAGSGYVLYTPESTYDASMLTQG